MREVVDKGVPFKKDKTITKDPFVGQINQLKMTVAKTPEKRSEFPEINATSPFMTDPKKKQKA